MVPDEKAMVYVVQRGDELFRFVAQDLLSLTPTREEVGEVLRRCTGSNRRKAAY